MIWNRLLGRRTSELLASRAEVATDSAERYARQLASHLGHRVAVETTADGDVYTFDGGRGVVRAGDGVLVLTAEGWGAEALGVVQDVLGRHLLKFGAKAGLSLTWTPAAPAAAAEPTEPVAPAPPEGGTGATAG